MNMNHQRNAFLSRLVENLNERSQIPSNTINKSTRSLSSSSTTATTTTTTTSKESKLIQGDKLVGREDQLQILLQCYGNMKTNNTIEIVIIHGTSGSGKSTLVQAFTKNLPPNVLSVQGKFDQHYSHTPYSALVSASDQLCRQILRNPNSGKIRERIRSLLGPDVNLLGNLIPKLMELTNDDSNTSTSRNALEDGGSRGTSFTRFKLVFRAFLRSVASAENPLIFFFDDLQWADMASLEVLKSIVTDSMANSTMILCAFREGEISKETLTKYYLSEGRDVMENDSISSHGSSKAHNSSITDIFLDSLDVTHLNDLISFKLGMEKASTQSLSQLIWNKTSGNPFYALNFLEMLYRNSLLTSTPDGTWIWDESQVFHMTNVSDNLASILESRIHSLSEQVRSILQMASFIGYEFPTSILITIVYAEQDTIASDYSFQRHSKQTIREWITSTLKIAVDEGLLEKSSHGDHYKFAHDKIQEVLYETLMPEEIERQLLHQRIGTLIWDSIKDKEKSPRDDWSIFLAADNLNRAIHLVDYSGNRCYLVELNLIAAKRMIQKSAFFVAAEYLRIAVDLLSNSSSNNNSSNATCWDEKYDLCLDLFNTAAETEKIVGCYSKCSDLLAVVHRQAKNLHHRSSAFAIEMDSLAMQGNVKESILLGLSVLRQLGCTFPRKINMVAVAKELLSARVALGRRKLHDLLTFPEITDQNVIVSLLIMSSVAVNAFIVGDAFKETYVVVCLRMFRITLNHGISKMHSPMAIVSWGTLNAVLGRFDIAFEAERVALELIDKYQMDSLRGTTIICSYLFNHFWRVKLDSDSRHEFFQAYQHAMSYGNISMAQFGFNAWLVTFMYLDDPLTELHVRARSVVSEMRALDAKSGLMFILPNWQLLLNYSGDVENPDPTSLRGEALDESFPSYLKEIDSKLGLVNLQLCEAIIRYAFDDADGMRKNLWFINKHESELKGYFTMGFIQTWLSIFHYEQYLLLGRRIHRRLGRISHRRVRNWATTGTNMLHGPNRLLDAMENLCVLNIPLNDVVLSFQDAARVCGTQRCRLFEALAYERLAKSLQVHDPEGDSHIIYHSKAMELYRKWGAMAKVNHLQQLFDQK